MAFGQSSGPPASARQLAYLTSLVQAAGYSDFREARHPLGLTQRQAGGKFSSKEASALIDRLVNGDPDEPEALDLGATPLVDVTAPVDDQADARALLLRGMPAELLADELGRRGWSVTPPR